MSKNSGYIVTTKKCLKGRTYHSKDLVNNKVPVYFICDICSGEGEHISNCNIKEIKNTAILCNANSLKLNGFID